MIPATSPRRTLRSPSLLRWVEVCGRHDGNRHEIRPLGVLQAPADKRSKGGPPRVGSSCGRGRLPDRRLGWVDDHRSRCLAQDVRYLDPGTR